MHPGKPKPRSTGFARPQNAAANGWASAFCQLAFFGGLCWWHLGEIPLHQPDLLSFLGWGYRGASELIWKNALLIALGVLLLGVFCYVVWRIVRVREPRATALPDFLYCWWQSSKIGILVIPAALGAAYLLFGHSAFGLPFVVLYMLFAPAAIAPRILPTVQRWRPLCPECGHTVAYAVVPRCSECGEPYPNSDRFYRRWAIRRLPWDRARRSLLIGYFQSLFRILFRPASAAWSLSIPDRMGRAWRWMLGHLVVPGLIVLGLVIALNASMSCNVRSYYEQHAIFPADTYDYSKVYLQTLQWFAAWTLSAVIFPAILGISLAAVAPRIQPAARIGIAKWSLYASVVPAAWAAMLMVLALGAQYGGTMFAGRILSIWPGVFGLMAFTRDKYIFLLPLLYLYAIWWAIGVASQPGLRRRGFFVFLVAFAAYLGALCLVRYLFDLRGFHGLL